MTVHKDLVERLRQAALIPRPTVKEKQLILFAAVCLFAIWWIWRD